MADDPLPQQLKRLLFGSYKNRCSRTGKSEVYFGSWKSNIKGNSKIVCFFCHGRTTIFFSGAFAFKETSPVAGNNFTQSGRSSGTKTNAITNLHSSAVQYVVLVSVLLVAGIVTCILSHYKMGARSWSDQRNRTQAQAANMQLQLPCPQQQEYTYALAPTTASIMYSPATIQERQRLEIAAYQDHLVQLQSVQTDLVLDLPHSIALPDGEEHNSQHHHHCEVGKHLKLRDPEQHSELVRNFIRPPPNRTVHEVDTLPPFRSNSVGLLQKPKLMPLAHLAAADTAPLVMRSHSMSSSRSNSGLHEKGCSSSSSSSAGSVAGAVPNPPNIPSSLWIPPLSATTNSSGLSGGGGSANESNRTQQNSTSICSKTTINDRNKSSEPPPPSCSEDNNVGNKWDLSTGNKQNSGI